MPDPKVYMQKNGKAGPISLALVESPEAGSPNPAAITANLLTFIYLWENGTKYIISSKVPYS